MQLLRSLLKQILYESVRGDDDRKITDICCHSEKVKEGSLFVCINGYRNNGHEYVPQAVEHGAAVLVVDDRYVIESRSGPVILTEHMKVNVYELIRDRNICVVGDDDQSIYKFRGANIENILSFEKAFPGARVIKLEQNYRSTQSILNAANEVIRHNRGRKDKTLWTANDEGPKVRFRQYDTAYEEADAIIRDIEREKEEKNAEYSDFAVLYRTNAQSRLL